VSRPVLPQLLDCMSLEDIAEMCGETIGWARAQVNRGLPVYYVEEDGRHVPLVPWSGVREWLAAARPVMEKG
jgi:hypothetical protein